MLKLRRSALQAIGKNSTTAPTRQGFTVPDAVKWHTLFSAQEIANGLNTALTDFARTVA